MALFVVLALAGSALGQELDWLWKLPVSVGSVRSVAYSGDGSLIATGSGMQEYGVRLWDVKRRRMIYQWRPEPLTQCNTVAISPDGTLVAGGFGSTTGTLRIWSIATGQLIRSSSSTTRVLAVAFSPNGSQLAIGYAGRLDLVSAQTGAVQFSFPTIDSVAALAYSRDGSRLAVGRASSFNHVQMIDPLVGQLRQQFPMPSGVFAVAFSPDGLSLGVGGNSVGFCRVIDSQSGSTRSIMAASDTNGLAFSNDGTRLIVARGVTSSSSGSATVFDTNTGVTIRTLSGFRSRTTAVAVSQTTGEVAIASDDSTVGLYPDESQVRSYTLDGHAQYFVLAAAFSPNGRWLATGGSDDWFNFDRSPRLWSVQTGSQVRRLTAGEQGETRFVAFSNDSTLLVGSGRGYPVWEVQSGLFIRNLLGTQTTTATAAFSPATQELALLSQIRDPLSGQVLRNVDPGARCFAYSPDGSLLAGGASDSRTRIWNASTGLLLRTVQEHTATINDVAFSPTGALFATASDDRSTRIWNTANGPSIRAWIHPQAVMSVEFTPDGEFLITSAADDVLRFWRTSDWTLAQSFPGVAANSVAVSKDGCLLGIGGYAISGVAFLHRPSISGHINLRDYTAGPTTQPLTLDFLIDGLVYESTAITLNSNGDFSTTAKVAPGEYEVKARASHWLTKSLGTVTISRTTAGLDAELINGDVNADNMIDIADYAVLSSAYGSSIGDPPYVANADLNGSGQVNIDDYNILANNYGLSGD